MVQFQVNARHDSIFPHLRGNDKEITNDLCVIFSVEENKHYFLHHSIEQHSNTVCVHLKVSTSFLMTLEAVKSYFPFNFVPMLGIPGNFISLTRETGTAICFSC